MTANTTCTMAELLERHGFRRLIPPAGAKIRPALIVAVPNVPATRVEHRRDPATFGIARRGVTEWRAAGSWT